MSCKICSNSNINFYCPIAQSEICVTCCNNFHIGKMEKWESLLDKEYDMGKAGESCLKCEGLIRNEDEEFLPEGFFSMLKFPYNGKYILDSYPGELYFKKQIELIKRFPLNELTDAYYIAESMYHLNEYSQAIEILGAVTEATSHSEVCLLIGKAYKFTGNYNEAKAYIEKAILIDNKDPVLCREFAEIHQLNGDIESSIHYYQHSLKLLDYDEENGGSNDDFHNMNYLGLAVSYSKLENHTKTIESAENYLESISSWDSLIERVHNHRMNIMKYINIEFEIHAYSTLYNLMAISYLELNDLNLAAKYIERAVELDKSDTSFAKLQGIIIGRQQGQVEISRYEEEVKIHREYAQLRVSSIAAVKEFPPEKQVVWRTGNNNENLQGFIIKQAFDAIRKSLHTFSLITPSIDKAADEDKYTDIFTDHLNTLLQILGWTAQAQSRGGFTREFFGIRGGVGERDFVIKSQAKKDLLIGEALILKGIDVANIKKHIEKPFGYDIQNSNFQLIIIWGLSKQPDDVWEKYKEIVKSRFNGNYSVIETGELENLIPEIDKQSIRTFYSKHSTDQVGEKATVIHAYIDIYNHKKRAIARTARDH